MEKMALSVGLKSSVNGNVTFAYMMMFSLYQRIGLQQNDRVSSQCHLHGGILSFVKYLNITKVLDFTEKDNHTDTEVFK